MSKRILITGATGLVGRKLIEELISEGHQIHILSRRDKQIANVKVFLWDVAKKQIDKNAFSGVDTIVHLAGEGIADKKWTDERKKQIIDSRVDSANLLYDTIAELRVPIKTFVSASAVGYYGNRGEENLTEDSKPGTGFLADCCVKWEAAANRGIDMGIRVAKIRIGVILSREGGALKSMEKPVQFYVGAPLGSGCQWIPWIHLDDIVGIFKKAVENDKFYGAFNASAPYPVTNKTLTKAIAKQLHRPVWPITVPAFALKSILGEMAEVVLNSDNTTSQKLLDSGYQFQFLNLDEALKAIYHQ